MSVGIWLVDPKTREPLPALPSGESDYARRVSMPYHPMPGWRSGFEYEDGIPVRMWYRQCFDECCRDDAVAIADAYEKAEP